MGLTIDDFQEFARPDPTDAEDLRLGDALAAVAVDVDVDAVAEVREAREQI